MNEATKIQKEIDQMMTKFKAAAEDQKAQDDFPKIKRTFNYRSSPAIRHADLVA